MAASSRELPTELVEKVLSCVPVPDLCRYRSVCRKWNTLICNPAFATVHAQNGKRPGASFVAMEMLGPEPSTWCLLDLNARHWYTFRDESNITDRCDASLGIEVAAMDGGLVCRFAKTEPQMLSLFVHDLLGHTVKSLPLIRRHLTSQLLPEAYMVVESTSHHFMIFLLNRLFDFEDLETLDITFEEWLKIMNDPLMRIYDSATGEWRSASNPPWTRELGFSDVVSMVMCQGLLYSLMEEPDEWSAVCYNLAENAWKCTHVCLSKRDTEIPRLIATTTRLFVSSWRFSPEVIGRGLGLDFEVSEISIPEMTLETLFKLPMPAVVELLEVKTRDLDFGRFFESNGLCRPSYVGMNVTGVDNALFMQSWLSGKAKVFDLDTCSWDHGLPELPLGRLCSGDGRNKITRQMNLLLPNSLQYLI